MPKSKSKTSPTATGAQTPVDPQYVNPFSVLSPETRWLMQNQIDNEIAKLERTAQELIAVKHSLISAGIQQAQQQAQTGPAIIGQGQIGQGQVAPPNAQPARKRGRPPGSKNKPKSAEPAEPADPVNPTQPTQTDMFSAAMDATRPERDAEFEAA